MENHVPVSKKNNEKSALILEGGAMRGMFTCGVIDVLMENKITFDGVAGISAGAAFGCNFKSKQIGRPLRYNKKYGRDPRYCSRVTEAIRTRLKRRLFGIFSFLVLALRQ